MFLKGCPPYNWWLHGVHCNNIQVCIWLQAAWHLLVCLKVYLLSFLSLTCSWWKLVHYYLTFLYPDYLQVYCWLWLDYWAQLCHLWTHAQWCICHRVWRGNKFELETLWSSFICIMHGRASENESNWHVISGTKKTNSTISSYF